MSILIKIGLCIGGVILFVGSVLVTIVVLFPPKEYKGDSKTGTGVDKWDETIEV